MIDNSIKSSMQYTAIILIVIACCIFSITTIHSHTASAYSIELNTQNHPISEEKPGNSTDKVNEVKALDKGVSFVISYEMKSDNG